MTVSRKPTLKLVGHDGNAFSIIARAIAAAKQAGWSKADTDAMTRRLTSASSYDDLLQIAMEEFDVE